MDSCMTVRLKNEKNFFDIFGIGTISLQDDSNMVLMGISVFMMEYPNECLKEMLFDIMIMK